MMYLQEYNYNETSQKSVFNHADRIRRKERSGMMKERKRSQ